MKKILLTTLALGTAVFMYAQADTYNVSGQGGCTYNDGSGGGNSYADCWDVDFQATVNTTAPANSTVNVSIDSRSITYTQVMAIDGCIDDINSGSPSTIPCNSSTMVTSANINSGPLSVVAPFGSVPANNDVTTPAATGATNVDIYTDLAGVMNTLFCGGLASRYESLASYGTTCYVDPINFSVPITITSPATVDLHF
jgi:hypothetical protein